MTAAEQIIGKFGNQTRLAQALGTRQSTISHWRQTGYIPKRWHAKILAAAEHFCGRETEESSRRANSRWLSMLARS
jgi:hypothetical protein